MEIEYIITGDALHARDTATRLLEARNFAVSWNTDWAATASRGSKGKNLLLGGVAQFMEIGVAIRTHEDGSIGVRLIGASAGWQGGLIGASRNKKNFNGVRDELQSDFRAAGILTEMRVIS